MFGSSQQLRKAARWSYSVAQTVVGPAEEAAQRQDVVRRALITPVILALILVPRLHIPGWQAVLGACVVALLYDIPLAYLVFAKRQIFAARVLAFLLDGLLLAGASIFVLRALGAANSNSDIWLAFLVFAVSGGFVLAPIGSLIYTALAISGFGLGTYLYFPASSQYHEQLFVRLTFFAVFGLMSLGIAQELANRRAKLLQQNRQLEEKSGLLERALETERERARHDPLTGVLNHAAIVEELRAQLDERDGARLAVAMVDVDGLKAINDTFGHQIGDAALLAVAKALSENGALVGRYGGDEFMAVLPNTDRSIGERYREAVLDGLASARVRDPESGSIVPVVATIGLAIFPDQAKAIDDLIRVSDSTMYAAKRQQPVGPAGETLPQPLGDDRAAKMVGEIVPFLTSPGDLSQKLRMVADRLSVGAGYDAVDFSLFASEPGAPLAQTISAHGPQELVEAWNREQRRDSPEPHPLRLLFARSPRPVILDDPWTTELLLAPQREILRAAKLRSVLVAPMIWQGQAVGSLGVASRREAAFRPSDAQFLTAVATQVTAIVRMATLVEELQSTSTNLQKAQTETVMLLAAAAEAHDHTTGLHLLGIRAVATALARELGYRDEEAQALGLAAVLHDIGKMSVPDAILSTSGPLRNEEWGIMKRHTVWGEEFLAGRPGFELAATIARSHHERWDGSGYPDGLSAETIPEAATIVAVADSFNAMTSDRPYREARPVAEVVQEIAACSGKQFNPRVVEALLRLYERGALPRVELLVSEKAAA